MKRQLMAVVMAVGVVTPTFAQSEDAASDVARLTRGAGKVVVGRIVDVQPRFETNKFGDQLIVSHALVEVRETLKGAHQPSVRIAVEGGSLGGLSLEVSDMPALAEGDEAVLFLEATTQGDAAPFDRGHGVMKLDEQGRVRGRGIGLDAVREHVRQAVAQGRGGR
jgi:hypothetical protein